jgi:hypothetical protein
VFRVERFASAWRVFPSGTAPSAPFVLAFARRPRRGKESSREGRPGRPGEGASEEVEAWQRVPPMQASGLLQGFSTVRRGPRSHASTWRVTPHRTRVVSERPRRSGMGRVNRVSTAIDAPAVLRQHAAGPDWNRHPPPRQGPHRRISARSWGELYAFSMGAHCGSPRCFPWPLDSGPPRNTRRLTGPAF